MPKLSKLHIEGKVIALTTAIAALESSIMFPPEDRMHETTFEMKKLKERFERELSKIIKQ